MNGLVKETIFGVHLSSFGTSTPKLLSELEGDITHQMLRNLLHRSIHSNSHKHLMDSTHIVPSSLHLNAFHLLIGSTFLSLPRESPQCQQSFPKQWQHSKYLSIGTACTGTSHRSGSGWKRKLCSRTMAY